MEALTFARTVRLPGSYEEKINGLADDDNMKSGPWLQKIIRDAVDRRVTKKKRARKPAA